VLTTRGYGLLLAAAGLWIGSRAFGVPELQIAAVAALLLVSVAVLGTRVVVTRLEVDRVVRPATLHFGERATVTLTVTNPSRLPTVPLELADHVPFVLSGHARTRLAALRPGGRATVRYPVTGTHRGRFELGPLTVRARDPFGLAERRSEVPGTLQLTVYPPIHRLASGLPLGGASASGTDGRARALPSGEDLANVREYLRGDDLRTVHWASTAHRGKLMVRQPESRQEPRAALLLDLRLDRHRGSGPSASVETAVAAAASIADHLARRGRAVVLLDRPLTGPARGVAWEPLLEHLADAQPEDIDLPALLQQVGQGLAGSGALLAVLPVPAAGELRQLVRAGRGFSTRAALLVDAASHVGQPSEEAGSTAAALRVAGWRVTTLRSGDRIELRWRELVAQRRAAVPAGGGR
jgi:uncharacterized protein (DUF58 family)